MPRLGVRLQGARSPPRLWAPRSWALRRVLRGRGAEATVPIDSRADEAHVPYRCNGAEPSHRKGRKPCRVQRHRWTSRAACQVQPVRRGKTTTAGSHLHVEAQTSCPRGQGKPTSGCRTWGGLGTGNGCRVKGTNS